MPKLLFLRLEIVFRLRAGIDFAWNTLNHAHSGMLQGRDFVWIVREQPNLPDAQRLQNLARQSEIAMVCLEAQSLIRFYGIEPGIL